MKKIETEKMKYEFIIEPHPLGVDILCGNCKKILMPPVRPVGVYPKYCSNCGGKIDWSKRNEIETNFKKEFLNEKTRN